MVLLGQDLGGRHQRHLVPVLHREQRRHRRHRRLARAHVALEQPVHRLGSRHVPRDLRRRALAWAPVSWNGSSRARPVHPLAVDRIEGDALLCLHALALEANAELQEEQLIERQPPVRGAQVRVERSKS